MVIIRRELPRTENANPGTALSHRLVEGSP
jgi:hypothetical protein